jgi:hypothetical protein
VEWIGASQHCMQDGRGEEGNNRGRETGGVDGSIGR